MSESAIRMTFGHPGLREDQAKLANEAAQALSQSFSALPEFLQEHCIRVGLLGQALLRAEQQSTGGKSGVDDRLVRDAVFALIWHDIGKQAVNKAILEKPASLNLVERRLLYHHPEFGYGFLHDVVDVLSHDVLPKQLSDMMLNACVAHHERWDGLGYPFKLSGKQIPFIARVAAIADSFDAMYASRPYCAGLGAARVASEIIRNAGTQFDPELIVHFERCVGQFEEIEQCSKSQLHTMYQAEFIRVMHTD